MTNVENEVLSKRLFQFLQPPDSNPSAPSTSQCDGVPGVPIQDDTNETFSDFPPSQIELQADKDIPSEITDIMKENTELHEQPTLTSHQLHYIELVT